MYLPPFESLLNAAGVDRAKYPLDSTITVPKGLFNLLVELALQNTDFDENSYLKSNPDVADFLSKGNTAEVSNGRQHYASYGYFEGRTGGGPAVDERWYLATYPDVDKAVKLGKLRSASEHFNVVGGGEGRSPNAACAEAAARWKKALGKT